jgi:hypothetical protein
LDESRRWLGLGAAHHQCQRYVEASTGPASVVGAAHDVSGGELPEGVAGDTKAISMRVTSYSIISSALTSRAFGTVRPNVFAVLRLMAR